MLTLAFAATNSAETGVPPTPLANPFTAVAKDMHLYNTTSIDSKVIGTVPTEIGLSFRESDKYEHWIYLDDSQHNIHG